MCRKRIATCLIGVALLMVFLVLPLIFSVPSLFDADVLEPGNLDTGEPMFELEHRFELEHLPEPVPALDKHEDRISQVKQAMGIIAKTAWPYDINKLLVWWKEGYTVDRWANIIVGAADRYGLDPLILVAVIWQEGKFKTKIMGDGGRSCGATQIRTDYKGRPSCQQLLNPVVAVDWTAKFLVNYAGCTGDTGHECLRKYNGGGYSKRVWKDVMLMRGAIQ